MSIASQARYLGHKLDADVRKEERKREEAANRVAAMNYPPGIRVRICGSECRVVEHLDRGRIVVEFRSNQARLICRFSDIAPA